MSLLQRIKRLLRVKPDFARELLGPGAAGLDVADALHPRYVAWFDAEPAPRPKVAPARRRAISAT